MTWLTRLTPWIATSAMAGAGLLFACSDEPGSLGAGGTTSAANGTGGMQAATTAAGSQAVVTTTGATTSSGMFVDCEPPPEAGTFYDNTDVGVFPPNDTLSMCHYAGEVLLIFNAAAI